METRQPVETKVLKTSSGWTLSRDGKPYFIKGVGGTSRLEDLAKAGGNSIRTWDGEDIGGLLDEAHELGLTVAVGIWLDHERHGYDYNDPDQRERQLDKVRTIVNKWKDHPAVLLWGIGNEVELGGDLPTAFRAIEEAAALAKSLDPNHPTMAVLAEIGGDKAGELVRACPSIDIVGVNAYAGVGSLPTRLRAQQTDKPYIVTEFGTRGHWEVQETPWGAPIEPSSAEKYRLYLDHYRRGVDDARGETCLGSYVFLWGHKQEVTGTWYGMLLDSGEMTPSVDAMTLAWTDREPDQRAPMVEPIRLDAGTLPTIAPGAQTRAEVRAVDPDGDKLTYTWVVRAESTDRKIGGDREDAPEELEGLLSGSGPEVMLTAPSETGAYRLFVTVYDGTGRAGTANVPFYVTGE